MAVKYILTYDFRIIYCKNVNLRIGLKELNFKKLNFTPFNEDPSILDKGFEISTEDVQYIVNTVFNSKLGYELPNKDMLWLETYEKKLKEDKSILNDKKVTFNYLVLKLMLIGFEEKYATRIIGRYYELLIDGFDVPHIEEMLNKINTFIDNKEFWINNEIYYYQAMELEFISKLFNSKVLLKYDFDFNNYKEDYFRLCYESLLISNYKFNSQASYLVSNPKSIEEQRADLIEVYTSSIVSVINHLLATDYTSLAGDEKFINTLVDNLIGVANTFIDTILMENNR